MKLKIVTMNTLPLLAWAAHVIQEAGTATLWCGKSVEISDAIAVEGAWDGSFEGSEPHKSSNIFGSAVVIDDGNIIFVSSSATTDYLYYQKKEGNVYVSNSLPLLMAIIDDSLDPLYDSYDLINESIMYGFQRYISTIPTEHGSINRLMYRNLVVGRNLVFEVEKSDPPHFSCYSDYVSYVKSVCINLLQNAKSSARSHPLVVASTQSRGYDSTAINALIGSEDIDMVFTVTKGKAPGLFADRDTRQQVDDDGSEICRYLKVNDVRPLDRREFETRGELEPLLIATLDSNQDANLFGICGQLPGPALLLTGTLGEIWYPEDLYQRGDNWSCDVGLARGDLSMHGLTELRIAFGFVQVAVPFVGAIHRRDILAISSSTEMDKWRLGNAYDRPIPRRIAEEAGVPRTAFGQRKMASVVEFSKPYLPVSAELRKEYQRFLSTNGVISWWQWWALPLVRWWNTVLKFKYYGVYKLVYYLERIVSKVMRREFKFPFVWGQLNGRVFCFGVNRRAAEYRKMIDESTRKVKHESSFG